MAIQPAICKQCGAGLSVEDVDLNGYVECPYCRTASKVIDVITIDGLPTAKTYLMNAEFALQNGDVDSAMKFYNQVIKVKPNCHEAWWGLYKLQCMVDEHYGYKDKYGNSGVNVKANMIRQALKQYAYRAIQFAPPNAVQWYKNQLIQYEKFINDVDSGLIKDKKSFLGGLIKF